MKLVEETHWGSSPDPEIHRLVPNGMIHKHPVSLETPGVPYGPAMALGSILPVVLSSMALSTTIRTGAKMSQGIDVPDSVGGRSVSCETALFA